MCEELSLLSSIPLATHTILAYIKLPNITLLTIYQLSTDHLWSIIKLKANLSSTSH